MKKSSHKENKNWPKPEELLRLLPGFLQVPNPDVYKANGYVVLDFETTNDDFGSPHNPDNELVLASWKCGPDHPRAGLHRKVGSVYDMAELLEDIRVAHFVIAHNAKFEMGWLERCGLDLAHTLYFCTMLAEHVLAGNRPWSKHLDDCLKRRGFGSKDRMGRLIRLGVKTKCIPTPWLGKYCDVDVVQTERLFLHQRDELIANSQLPVIFTRNILTPVLYDIEAKGLHLDQGRVTLLYNHYLNREAELASEWAELSGGVNPKSGKQKIEFLYEKLGIPTPRDDQGREMLTEKGKVPSTDAAALKALKTRKPEQRKAVATLQALTSTRDALSKYIGKLKECADNGGILYAQFKQHVAQTHRLSSTGTNYSIQHQNFQRKFRPVVNARNPGWFMGDGDSSGIEFRTAVDLAKDNQGLSDIKNDVDIHANTARVTKADAWDESLGEKVGNNKKLRQAAKADTFKPLYGGQSGTEVQREYFAFFRNRYSEVAAMQQGWAETVLRDKCLRIASGLIFYWPGCKLSKDGKYIKYTTQIYDYPIQSFATADLCTTATVYLWHLMRVAEMESFLVNIVHDSAVGEIHPNEREQWSCYMQFCFNKHIVWYLKQVYDYDWVTPLASEVNIKPYWDDSPDWEDKYKPREH